MADKRTDKIVKELISAEWGDEVEKPEIVLDRGNKTAPNVNATPYVIVSPVDGGVSSGDIFRETVHRDSSVIVRVRSTDSDECRELSDEVERILLQNWNRSEVPGDWDEIRVEEYNLNLSFSDEEEFYTVGLVKWNESRP